MSGRHARLRRNLRQTWTIARRDFHATVFTPIFLLFLFAPVLMGSFGAIGGVGAARVSGAATDRSRLLAIAAPADRPALRGADTRLRRLFRREDRPPPLDFVTPQGGDARRALADFNSAGGAIAAVLHGPGDRAEVVYRAGERRAAYYLSQVARTAVEIRRAQAGGPVSVKMRAVTRSAPSAIARDQAGFIATFCIFFLTLFLSGQVVGAMAEERNSKVIEVLAAAVPLESVFFGKLLGMFGVALLFVGFWGLVVSQIGLLLPASASVLAALRPAVGILPFALLFAAYFTMAFLLLGSVFLGVGAQASTMREIQMLSLPITFVQVGMFALASAAASQPGSALATFAAIFPLSSPFVMAGRAAADPALWPHAAALGWQAMWVAVFIALGARLFRRGALQSGSGAGPWRRLFGRGDRAPVPRA